MALFIASFAFNGLAIAQNKHTTVTAICKNPTGHVFNFDKPNSNDPNEITDGFKNVTWTFFWDSNNPSNGKVITQSSASAGGTPIAADTYVYIGEPVNFTFISQYQYGVWIYTLYPEEKIMVASRHMSIGVNNFPSGGTFYAKCNVSVS